MSGDGQIGGGLRAFEVLASTLLALADLAERAATIPLPVRWLVLWAAQQADLVVKEFLAGRSSELAWREWAPAVAQLRYGNEPADAINLALSLRVLACLVRALGLHTALMADAEFDEPEGLRICWVLAEAATSLRCQAFGPAFAAPDTS